MQLQKHISRRIGDTQYSKWVVVLPNKIIIEAQLEQGQELNARVIEGKIILEKKINYNETKT